MENEQIAALINEKFSQVNDHFRQMDDRFQQMDGRLRGIGIEIEGLRSSMQLNNEMIHAVDQKLETFRTETKDNFKTVYDVIGTSHTQLISRIRKLDKAS